MSKTFFPEKSILLDASAPHPANTQYKVSVGSEDWGGGHHRVLKVQMVYDGAVSGRRSPSYPLGTDDAERVNKAIQELLSQV